MLFLPHNQATGDLTKSCTSTSTGEVGPKGEEPTAWGGRKTVARLEPAQKLSLTPVVRAAELQLCAQAR